MTDGTTLVCHDCLSPIILGSLGDTVFFDGQNYYCPDCYNIKFAEKSAEKTTESKLREGEDLEIA